MSSAPPAATARGRRRREAIVDAATSLFDEVGYHAASMDEIGAAAGISGPGLYRHFASKDDLLIAVFDRVWLHFRPAIEDAAGLPPAEALERLIDTHVSMAIADPAALMLLARESRHVPGDYQRAAARNHGRYVDAWIAPLVGVRPDLGEPEARALALAVHGLIDSAAVHPRTLPDAARRALLAAAAHDAIAATHRAA